MKHKKKIITIIVLSLVVCTMILSPFTSFAAVQSDGKISFDFIQEPNYGKLTNTYGAVYIPANSSRYLTINQIESNLNYVDLEGFSEYINLFFYGGHTQLEVIQTFDFYDDMGMLFASLRYRTYSENGSRLHVIESFNTYNSDGTYHVITSPMFHSYDLHVLTSGLQLDTNYTGYFNYGFFTQTYPTQNIQSLNVPTNSFIGSSDHPHRMKLDVEVINHNPSAGVFVGFAGSTTPLTTSQMSDIYNNSIVPQSGKIASFFASLDVTPNNEITSALQQERAEGWQEGYQEGVAEKDEAYDEGYDFGIEAGKAEGWQEGYDKGLADAPQDSYNKGYNEGKNDGLDEGYRIGVDTANKLPEAIDKIGLVITKSFAIFGGYGNLFGYSLLDIIVSIVTMIIAIWLARKVVHL